jgi:hypothetical protein
MLKRTVSSYRSRRAVRGAMCGNMPGSRTRRRRCGGLLVGSLRKGWTCGSAMCGFRRRRPSVPIEGGHLFPLESPTTPTVFDANVSFFYPSANCTGQRYFYWDASSLEIRSLTAPISRRLRRQERQPVPATRYGASGPTRRRRLSDTERLGRA